MRPMIPAIAFATLLAGFAAATAQHTHSHAPHGAAATDAREFVAMPAALVEHTLANMRDHLAALQEIQERLGMGHADEAARIAEARLGMSSLATHGAHEVAKYMPEGMRNAGTSMHRAASKFAIIATDSGVSGELKPVLAALAEITSACVACHSGYRFK